MTSELMYMSVYSNYDPVRNDGFPKLWLIAVTLNTGAVHFVRFWTPTNNNNGMAGT